MGTKNCGGLQELTQKPSFLTELLPSSCVLCLCCTEFFILMFIVLVYAVVFNVVTVALWDFVSNVKCTTK